MESGKYSPNNNNFRCLVASTNIFLGMKEHMDACFYDYLLGRKGVQDTHWLKKKKKKGIMEEAVIIHKMTKMVNDSDWPIEKRDL